MTNKPRCLFLKTQYDFDEIFPKSIQKRLDSVVEIVRVDKTQPSKMDDIHFCVSWDDSPAMAHHPSTLDLIVHCGLRNAQNIFPSIISPIIWKSCAGPRAWDSAGLKQIGGGRWISATERIGSGLSLVTISEPIERSIAEKLLGITILIVCDNSPDSTDHTSTRVTSGLKFKRDFYDICIGFVGCGGPAAAFARLLRNFEIGLIMHDPDLSPQQVHELGAEYCEDFRILVSRSDLIILFQYTNPQRPIPVAELWSHFTSESRLLVLNEQWIEKDRLSRFRGSLYTACANGTDNRYIGLPDITLFHGVDKLLPNSLGRVGKQVVDVIHRYSFRNGCAGD